MIGSIASILGSVSAIAGIGSAVGAAYSAFASRAAARSQVRQLTETSEQLALQSTDIHILGTYLYENVGNARISNYVRDDALRSRVTRALDAITSFVGSEPTEPESEVPESAAVRPELVSNTARTEMERALNDIRFGETWNGLARIRRIVEIRLRELSPEVPDDKYISVGRMLTSLSRIERIPPHASRLLRYAISVSNAGIHGQEVSASQAEEAWNCAVEALAMLEPGGSAAESGSFDNTG